MRRMGQGRTGDLRLRVLGLLGIFCCLAGCAPSWHSGDENWSLHYYLETAEVIDDSLIVVGGISPIVSLTEVGVKVRLAEDSTGRLLAFRSFRTLWAKELLFVMEFDKPARAAKSVNLDMVFTSRSGLQNVTQAVPIEWDATPDYRNDGAGAFD